MLRSDAANARVVANMADHDAAAGDAPAATDTVRAQRALQPSTTRDAAQALSDERDRIANELRPSKEVMEEHRRLIAEARELLAEARRNAPAVNAMPAALQPSSSDVAPSPVHSIATILPDAAQRNRVEETRRRVIELELDNLQLRLQMDAEREAYAWREHNEAELQRNRQRGEAERQRKRDAADETAN
jgi:hypothetical protein